MNPDFASCFHTVIDSNSADGRRAPLENRSRRGQEVVCRVFGIDASFYCVTRLTDILLRELERRILVIDDDPLKRVIDDQKTIEEIDAEYIEKLGRLWDEYDKEAKDYFIEKGGKVIVLPKAESDRWAQAVRPVLDDYVKEMKSKGLPGDEALKFFQDYLKAHQN